MSGLPICTKLRLYDGVPGPSAPERLCLEAAATIDALYEALELSARRLDVAAENSRGGEQSSHAFLGYQQWAKDARAALARARSEHPSEGGR